MAAAGAANLNPDDAARAIELSGATGVPAPAIAGDLDNFEAQHKATLAAQVVKGNPQLNSYVQSHPLAAQVSNDDFGALDQFSQSAGQTSSLVKVLNTGVQAVKSAAAGAAEGFAEGFGDQPLGQQFGQPKTALGTAANALGWVPLDFLVRGTSAIAGAASHAAGGAATAVGGEQFGRDIQAMTEYEMTKGEGHGPMLEAAHKAAPWVDAGQEPPTGLHPIIDQAKAQMNQHALDGLDQSLKDAQSSATKERSPELFAQFVRQHYGDAEVGIHGDAVSALYGDKVPSADDGLLGWVPGIADKLAVAKETGADVSVPISDWISNVDPTVANNLHDDIRMWPGGITAREASVVAEPKAVVDSPLASVRDSASLEPLQAIGDRKLTLDPAGQILDDQGKPLGTLEHSLDGTDIRLGGSSLDLSSAGPGLVEDLKKQLSVLYPQAQTVEGIQLHAPSGWGEIDTTNEFNQFRKVLEDAHWQGVSQTRDGTVISANYRPTELYSEHHQALAEVVNNTLRGMIGEKPSVETVAGIRWGDTMQPHGLFSQYRSQAPKILVDLFSENPVGVARHEGIHYLRQYGLIKPEEWSALESAAKSEGWLQRYGIESRYGPHGFSDEVKLEEAVAEGYRDWADNRDRQPDTPVNSIFQKMAEFWDKIKAQFSAILGREPKWEDLFENIYQGGLAGREGDPLKPDAFRFSLPDDARAEMREQLSALRASAHGLDVKTWNKIQRLVQERYAEDIQAAVDRKAKEEARTQTAEWKENQKVVRAEVEETIRQRPDVAADLMLSKGELYGEKLNERPKLLASDLTEEQKAALPRSYYGTEGLPTDMVANLFGYGSGDAMVEKLAAYKELRGDLSSEDMIKKVVDQETQRQMEAKYGQLHDNIMETAQFKVLSDTNIDLMSEELKAAGQQAGTAVKDKATLQAWVKGEVAKTPIGSLKSQHWMDVVGRHGRDAEKHLINGDPASAVVSLQRKLVAAMFAKEAKTLEKEVASFDRQAKALSKREPAGIEPEYTNFIHQILGQIGKPVRRSVQDLQDAIGHGTEKDLASFIEAKQADLREVPVWDQLYDSGYKADYKKLTAEEFRNVRDSIKALVFNGRDERKIYKAGEAEDFAEVKDRLLESLKQFPELTYDAKDQRRLGPLGGKVAGMLRSYGAMHTQIETLLNRWDKFDPKSDWNQYAMRGLIEGANQKDAWIKEFAEKIRKTDDGVDLKKAVDNNIFTAQVGRGAPLKLNRGNLRAIMLNVGNESNLQKLAKGRGLEPAQVMDWIHQRATKEDWEWVQKTWDIFGELKEKSDTMYRSLSGGVAAEAVPSRSIETPHGTYPGGYYPVIYASEGQRSRVLSAGKGPLEEPGYVRAATPAGYTKSRTGYVGPVALDIDQMPNRMKQVIHDTALRPAVINANKIFSDPKILNEISGRYGKEYKDLLGPYLKDVANNSNFMSKAQQSATAFGEFARQNLISSLVGLNPSTVLKHGPTAFIQSLNEVGAGKFLAAAKGMFSVDEATGESNWQFAMQNSQELQRRHQNYQETLSGAVQSMVPTSKYDSLRRTVMKYSSMPVAMSDLLSATPTWLAQYKSAVEEGESHGDAVYLADRAVRRAHGSTSVTNRPSVVRDASPWLTSVYGFFNHILNRQMEMVWKAGEMTGDVKDGNYQAAMAKVPEMAGMVFAYAIAPAIIEQIVQGQIFDTKDKKSWIHKAADALLETGGASWVGVRDITSALASGRDPTSGLGGTAMKAVTDFYRDLGKKEPLNKEHAGRLIQDSSMMIGTLTGLTNVTEGKAARFGYGVAVGTEHPKSPWQWVQGLHHGTLKEPR